MPQISKHRTTAPDWGGTEDFHAPMKKKEKYIVLFFFQTVIVSKPDLRVTDWFAMTQQQEEDGEFMCFLLRLITRMFTVPTFQTGEIGLNQHVPKKKRKHKKSNSTTGVFLFSVSISRTRSFGENGLKR